MFGCIIGLLCTVVLPLDLVLILCTAIIIPVVVIAVVIVIIVIVYRKKHAKVFSGLLLNCSLASSIPPAALLALFVFVDG